MLALSSCSTLGGGAAAPAATPSVTAVVDPSVPSPSASAEHTVPPDPTDTPSTAPTASAPASAPATLGTVTPFVTTAGWDASSRELVASAIVPKIVEQGGICTLTATRNGVTRTASAGTGPGAQYTGCGSLALPGSKLAAGSWTVTVSYRSAKYSGTSAPRTVTVGG